ncbi:pentapeptide repeat-containing protein [Clostridium sp.]|uniref:pentapeptide repeat-containing protein n=1 Tax=Clostridium sp. TaxID=1506 RepID=UPI003F317847
MAYINFKEEKVKSLKQLGNRRKNNEKIYNEMIGGESLSSEYIPDKEFSYKAFEDKHWGDNKIKLQEDFKEIKDKDIICATFNNCTFKNITFKNCKFIGCKFIQCKFQEGGVVFENCIFIKEESDTKPNLNNKDNYSCDFIDCSLYVKFYCCNLSYAIFENSILYSTSIELTDASNIIINKCELNKVNIQDADLSGIKVLSSYIVDLEFTDKDKSKLDEKSFFDKIQLREKDKDEYEGIYKVYETIANKFKENQLNNNFGEYYYLCKITERKTVKILPKIGSYINWITCGYGERASFAIYASIGIILIFSLIYLIIGIEIDNEIIRYGLNTSLKNKNILRDINESINLSVGMFAGVGFNNAQPIEAAYMVSNLEMVTGVIMMGVGIGALVKKIVR